MGLMSASGDMAELSKAPPGAALHAATLASSSATAAASGGDASEGESDLAGDKLKSTGNRSNIPDSVTRADASLV